MKSIVLLIFIVCFLPLVTCQNLECFRCDNCDTWTPIKVICQAREQCSTFKLKPGFGPEKFQAGCSHFCLPLNNAVFQSTCCRTNLCNNFNFTLPVAPTTTMITTTTSTTTVTCTTTTTTTITTTTTRPHTTNQNLECYRCNNCDMWTPTKVFCQAGEKCSSFKWNFGVEKFQAGCSNFCQTINNNVFESRCCRTNLCNNFNLTLPVALTSTTSTAIPVTTTMSTTITSTASMSTTSMSTSTMSITRPLTTISTNAGSKVVQKITVMFNLTFLSMLVIWRFL